MQENKIPNNLSEKERDLLEQALNAQKNAYCPYSNYPVGAIVLSENNNIYEGWNVEAVNFNGTTHAEQNAICRMPENDRKIKILIFVSKDGGFPCGHCRQIINEFSSTNTKIIGLSTNTNIITIDKISNIFPSPMKIGKDALK